jgi:hypothetical protein
VQTTPTVNLEFINKQAKMKLKIDAIEGKFLPLNMQGQPVQQPVLKFVAGDFEATTSRYVTVATHFNASENVP